LVRNLSSKKKLLSMVAASLVTVFLFASISFADFFSGGRSSAVFYAYYDSSVTSYGYTSHYDAARANWNGISQEVAINKTSSPSGTPDKYYVGTTTTPGLLGRTIPYKASGGTYVPASTSEQWAYCTVSIYHNTMSDNNMNHSQIVSNATHELGHTLSLAHPTSFQISVMNQGIQSIGPTTYDKNQLKAKWES